MGRDWQDSLWGNFGSDLFEFRSISDSPNGRANWDIIRDFELIPIHAFSPPATLETLFVARLVDQNPPHGLGRRPKEVPSAIPMLDLLSIYQSQIGLVDQRRGLERLARLFVSQFRGGQFTQFFVNQGKEVFGSLGVALFDGRQDEGHIAHASHLIAQGDKLPPVNKIKTPTDNVYEGFKVATQFAKSLSYLLTVNCYLLTSVRRNTHHATRNINDKFPFRATAYPDTQAVFPARGAY